MALNVPSPAEPLAGSLSVGRRWYEFFVNLLRLVNNNLAITRGDDTTYTIASGTITITKFGLVQVDTEAAAATDDLDTINGSAYGAVIVVRGTNSGRDVTLTDGVGNLTLASNCTLSNVADTITLIGDGNGWLEIARSDNA